MAFDNDPEQPAFPRSYVADGHNGMDLRDWFAGQALASMDSETKKLLHDAACSYGVDLTEYIATSCYEIADAMMKARAKTGASS